MEFPSNKGSVAKRLIAGMMMGLYEVWISFMLVHSACNAKCSWVGAEGQWLKDWIIWCVLSICLENDFQCPSRCPNDMCVMMSHEWHVGYAFKTGWKSTDSPFSLAEEVLMRVIMYNMLEVRWVLNYLQTAMYKEWLALVIESDSRKICRVVDIFSSSAKLCIYVPKFYWRFKY